MSPRLTIATWAIFVGLALSFRSVLATPLGASAGQVGCGHSDTGGVTGTLGDGVIENLSSAELTVIYTDRRRFPMPVINRLPPCFRTPDAMDFDGVRASSGASISGHTGFWKVPDGGIGTVSGTAEKLVFSCNAPPFFRCIKTDKVHDDYNDWSRAEVGPDIVMVPIAGCSVSAP